MPAGGGGPGCALDRGPGDQHEALERVRLATGLRRQAGAVHEWVTPGRRRRPPAVLHSPSGLACVRGCSNLLRGSLVSIVGPGDLDARLLAPFHAVLAKSRNNLVAQRKLAWVCQ